MASLLDNEFSAEKFNLENQLLPENLWALVQRFLVFEEPAYKWLHIRRWLKRLGPHSAEQKFLSTFIDKRELTKRRTERATGEIEKAASEIASVKYSSFILFSHLFALEEIKRFKSSALQKWTDFDLDNLLTAPSFPFIESEKSTWLKLMACMAYPLALLNRQQLGDADQRFSFILEWCKSHNLDIQEFSQLDKKKWQQLESDFKQLLQDWRIKLPGNFLPDFILLVEGATEAILLPALTKSVGLDLNASGAMLIAAGGANQVAKKYQHWQAVTSIPIFCLLDQDATSQKELIEQQLRTGDHLYVFKDGEIEDILTVESLVLLLNNYLETLPQLPTYPEPISVKDFENGESRTIQLNELWRKRQLGKFDKVDFAKFLVDQFNQVELLAQDGRQLVESLLIFILDNISDNKI